jgi:superfamily II DNA/RNA helicase
MPSICIFASARSLVHSHQHDVSYLSQRARLKAVESLQQSTKRTVVVATDVAARGLDIPAVTTVVHYDIPRTVDLFVHRSGRTAVGNGFPAYFR